MADNLADDLDALTVHTDTTVGWCSATPPNETVDADGVPFRQEVGFSAADPRAPRVRAYDHPDVVGLRAHLQQNNGIRGTP